jgi:uncharacterized protein YndB with AHSA1/START domain
MKPAQNLNVCVVRRFSASPERVFDAWLDPAMVGRFMFGPGLRDEEIVGLSIDARVGGSFSFLVRRQGEVIDHVGEYLQIDRPRRLVFTWGIAQHAPDTSRVVIDIVPVEAGSELTLTHELHPAWADYASRTQAGWTSMLDALARSLGPPEVG